MGKVASTVHVVDDDRSFRSATGELLGVCGYKVVLHESAKQLLETSLAEGPACILLDVRMAGLSGPQLQDYLSRQGCRLPIVFISAHGDIPTTVKAIKAGAEDFLTKPVIKEKLLEVVEQALERYYAMAEEDGQRSTLRSLFAQLTPRESEVFSLLVRGKPHKQIAYELGISERTVKLHRHQVVQKLRVRSLAELAVIAERLRLLPSTRDDERTGKNIQETRPGITNSVRIS